jgi:hypothetical protein
LIGNEWLLSNKLQLLVWHLPALLRHQPLERSSRRSSSSNNRGIKVVAVVLEAKGEDGVQATEGKDEGINSKAEVAQWASLRLREYPMVTCLLIFQAPRV